MASDGSSSSEPPIAKPTTKEMWFPCQDQFPNVPCWCSSNQTAGIPDFVECSHQWWREFGHSVLIPEVGQSYSLRVTFESYGTLDDDLSYPTHVDITKIQLEARMWVPNILTHVDDSIGSFPTFYRAYTIGERVYRFWHEYLTSDVFEFPRVADGSARIFDIYPHDWLNSYQRRWYDDPRPTASWRSDGPRFGIGASTVSVWNDGSGQGRLRISTETIA